MIGHANAAAAISHEVRRESAEVCPVGQKNREMIQTEDAVFRDGLHAGLRMHVNERTLPAVRSQRRRTGVTMQDPQSNRTFVVFQRPIEIADLQMHGTHVRGVGQPESWRRNAIGAGCVHVSTLLRSGVLPRGPRPEGRGLHG